MQELAERFWSKVRWCDCDWCCWEWQAAKDTNGRGVFGAFGKQFASHRIAWWLTHGGEMPTKFVCHECDNPACVRPSHLFLGTAQDNMGDMRKKGRGIGQHWSEAKISEVIRLLSAGVPVTTIAKRFGITRGQLYKIMHRRHIIPDRYRPKGARSNWYQTHDPKRCGFGKWWLDKSSQN